MTDLNLKAMRVKQVIAMFMAVCLTVLSVNVDVFAAAAKDTTYMAGKASVSANVQGVTTSVDGEEVDVTISLNEIKVGGVVTTATSLKGLEISDDCKKITVSSADLVEDIDVVYPENAEAAERIIDATVYVEGKNGVAATDIVIKQGVLTKEDYKKGDDVVDKDGKKVSAYDPDFKVTNPDGFKVIAPEDALDKDLYAGDLIGIVTNVDGKKIKNLKDDSKLITVTVYDGLSPKGGNIVAIYKKAPGSVLTATSKVKAVETNYVEGKVFDGWTVANVAKSRNGKKIKTITAGDTAFDFATAVTENTYVIADRSDVVVTGLNAKVTVQVGKKTTARVVVPAGYKSFKVTLTKDDKKNVKSATVSKKGIISVTANSKSKAALGTYTYDVMGKVSSKISEKVGTLTVEVVETAPVTEIELITTNGLKNIALDKSSASKKAQLIANPETTGVKYVATAATLPTGVKSGLTKKAAQALVKVAKADRAKAVSVTGAGLVTAKAAGNNNVYAYKTIKVGSGKSATYTVVISNPVNVNVTSSSKSFSFTGGKKFTYKTTGKKAKTAYTVKKNTAVKFVAKATAGSSDEIAIRAINMKGEVVLGLQQKIKKNTKTCTNTLVPGYDYQAKDDLVVVATAPSGDQKYKTLRFVAKK